MTRYRLDELAEKIGGTVRGDESIEIASVGGLDDVKPDGITLAGDLRRLEQAVSSPAAAIIAPSDAPNVTKPLILHPLPRLGFAKALELFIPWPRPYTGVHPTCIVSPEAQIDPSASVGAFCYIDPGAIIGANTVIHPHAFIGQGAKIGRDCILYPHVTLMPDVSLGDRAILHPGVVIGADGYGYVQHNGGHYKMPQIGTVIIEDDVEIGANSTVDRATTGATRIGAGTKIDNLCMIAHNVQVGKNCLIISQVGIAGSSSIGDNVVLAGQVGVKDHVHIGSGTVIGAKSGVLGDIPDGGVYLGSPAIPHREWAVQLAASKKLPQLLKRVEELERKLNQRERD